MKSDNNMMVSSGIRAMIARRFCLAAAVFTCFGLSVAGLADSLNFANWRVIMYRIVHFLGFSGLALIFACPTNSFAADPLGVNGEVQVSLTGKVVDILCEIGHDCAPNCGGGKRQLALKTADNKLYFASKSHVIFAGLTNDLIQYCGKEIIADGLVTSAYGSKMLFIQQYKTSATGEWIEATQFRTDWAKAHGVEPDSETAKSWYKTDETVRAGIALHGKLGLTP